MATGLTKFDEKNGLKWKENLTYIWYFFLQSIVEWSLKVERS